MTNYDDYTNLRIPKKTTCKYAMGRSAESLDNSWF